MLPGKRENKVYVHLRPTGWLPSVCVGWWGNFFKTKRSWDAFSYSSFGEYLREENVCAGIRMTNYKTTCTTDKQKEPHLQHHN